MTRLKTIDFKITHSIDSKKKKMKKYSIPTEGISFQKQLYSNDNNDLNAISWLFWIFFLSLLACAFSMNYFFFFFENILKWKKIDIKIIPLNKNLKPLVISYKQKVVSIRTFVKCLLWLVADKTYKTKEKNKNNSFVIIDIGMGGVKTELLLLCIK